MEEHIDLKLETERDEVASEEGFGAKRSGGVRGESWVGVGEESGGAEAEVHEDTVGDSGVKWRKG